MFSGVLKRHLKQLLLNLWVRFIQPTLIPQTNGYKQKQWQNETIGDTRMITCAYILIEIMQRMQNVWTQWLHWKQVTALTVTDWQWTMTMYTGFEYRRHAETVDRSELRIEVTHQPIIIENIVILVQQSPFVPAGVTILWFCFDWISFLQEFLFWSDRLFPLQRNSRYTASANTLHTNSAAETATKTNVRRLDGRSEFRLFSVQWLLLIKTISLLQFPNDFKKSSSLSNNFGSKNNHIIFT